MEFERARPALDLSRTHFKRKAGDITVYGTWLYDPEQDEAEPCLVLMPTFRVHAGRPCVIALSSAYKYAEPVYLAHVAAHFVSVLGFEASMATANRIANLIYDHLGDLINIPPDPTEAIVVGQSVITHANGSRENVEIVDHEPLH